MRRLPTGVLLFRVKVLSPRANLSPRTRLGSLHRQSAGGIPTEVCPRDHGSVHVRMAVNRPPLT
jgi:hypothetical protein